MIVREYEKIMNPEETRELIEGRSNLTMGFNLKVYEKVYLPTKEKAIVSIEGNDGFVYTGLLISSADINSEYEPNRVILQFRLGDNQPTKSLDDKVSKHGFVPCKQK